jgi:hypothetical protein
MIHEENSYFNTKEFGNFRHNFNLFGLRRNETVLFEGTKGQQLS